MHRYSCDCAWSYLFIWQSNPHFCLFLSYSTLFIISGYLTRAEAPRVAKLAKRLLVPYGIICLLTLALSVIKDGYSGNRIVQIVGACVWASGGDVPVTAIPDIALAWFSMASFVAKVLFQFLQDKLEERNVGFSKVPCFTHC